MKKILEYLMRKFFRSTIDVYEDTIEYLYLQRQDLIAQLNILADTEWDMRKPTFIEMIRLLTIYGAQKKGDQLILRTNPISILYPIFFEKETIPHVVVLDLVNKILYLDGKAFIRYDSIATYDEAMGTDDMSYGNKKEDPYIN